MAPVPLLRRVVVVASVVLAASCSDPAEHAPGASVPGTEPAAAPQRDRTGPAGGPDRAGTSPEPAEPASSEPALPEPTVPDTLDPGDLAPLGDPDMPVSSPARVGLRSHDELFAAAGTPVAPAAPAVTFRAASDGAGAGGWAARGPHRGLWPHGVDPALEVFGPGRQTHAGTVSGWGHALASDPAQQMLMHPGW